MKAVEDAAFSPDGKTVLTRSQDRTARLSNARRSAAPVGHAHDASKDDVLASGVQPRRQDRTHRCC